MSKILCTGLEFFDIDLGGFKLHESTLIYTNNFSISMSFISKYSIICYIDKNRNIDKSLKYLDEKLSNVLKKEKHIFIFVSFEFKNTINELKKRVDNFIVAEYCESINEDEEEDEYLSLENDNDNFIYNLTIEKTSLFKNQILNKKSNILITECKAMKFKLIDYDNNYLRNDSFSVQ